MNSSIYVPKRLNVGFQRRNDTYTGKLAYVTYYDEKNKLRKEASWNGWRDTSIPNEEFDNEPISGFVLNKKVGDCSSGWNHRRAYCRVYDPRNFEFEITIENLLYILENTNSIKGKGLEGEFVYGWSGKDLVLMPVGSPDYEEIMRYTDKVRFTDTVRAKDLIVGALYKDKEDHEYVYMGKHEAFKKAYKFTENGVERLVDKYNKIPYNRDYFKVEHNTVYVSDGERMWFVRLYKKINWESPELSWTSMRNRYNFETYKQVPKKIIELVNESAGSEYEVILKVMQSLETFSCPDTDRREFVPYDLATFKGILGLGKENTRYETDKRMFSDTQACYTVSVEEDGKISIGISKHDIDIFDTYGLGTGMSFGETLADFDSRFCSMRVLNRDGRYTVRGLDAEQAFNLLKPGYVRTYLKNGSTYRELLKLECRSADRDRDWV